MVFLQAFPLAELQAHLVLQSQCQTAYALCQAVCVCMMRQLFVHDRASSISQEVVGVLRFGYGTTNGIHSKQLCLIANVY